MVFGNACFMQTIRTDFHGDPRSDTLHPRIRQFNLQFPKSTALDIPSPPHGDCTPAPGTSMRRTIGRSAVFSSGHCRSGEKRHDIRPASTLMTCRRLVGDGGRRVLGGDGWPILAEFVAVLRQFFYHVAHSRVSDTQTTKGAESLCSYLLCPKPCLFHQITDTSIMAK